MSSSRSQGETNKRLFVPEDQCPSQHTAREGTSTSSSTSEGVGCAEYASTSTNETSEEWTDRIVSHLPVKPFYAKDGIIILCSDCRDILPLLPQVDLVLTDPPYGMNYQSNWSPKHLQKGGVKNDHEFPLWLFDAVKPRVALLAFCRWSNLRNMPEPKSVICWDKGVHSMGDLQHEFGRMWEACAFYPGPEHLFRYRPVDVVRCMRVSPEKMTHPTEKPVGAILPLIDCHESQTILDPFMGSGTTLVAAKLLGKKAIGIELEEKYCQIAVERLAQGILFGAGEVVKW